MAIAVATVVGALLSACGYDDGRDLTPIVDWATPTGARPLARCGGSEGLIEPPSHGCAFLVPGKGTDVTATVAARFEEDGFRVVCPRAGEVEGARGDVSVAAQVVERGWYVASGQAVNLFDEGYRPKGSEPVPRGWVAVKISAWRDAHAGDDLGTVYDGSSGRCDRPLERFDPIAQCAEWWNGPVGTRTREAASRERVRTGVHVAHEQWEAGASCTYLLRLRGDRRSLRVTARFDDGRWSWSHPRRVDERAPTVNARLTSDGRLVARRS